MKLSDNILLTVIAVAITIQTAFMAFYVSQVHANSVSIARLQECLKGHFEQEESFKRYLFGSAAGQGSEASQKGAKRAL